MPEDYEPWPILEGIELPPDADFVDPDSYTLWPFDYAKADDLVCDALHQHFYQLTKGQFK